MTAIQFNSLFPVAWVLTLALLICVSLGWLEIRRKQRLLIPRLASLILAISALACIILNPERTVTKSSGTIILTKDFDRKILDSLIQVNSGSQVIQFADAKAGRTIREITDYRTLDQITGNVSVLGQGFPDYMLDYMNTSSLQFFPAKLPDGFIRINTPDKIIANQPATVEGVIQSAAVSKISLSGPGVTEDSLNLTPQSSGMFSLTFTPKTSGLYVYNLRALDSSGNTLHSEQLPVEVHEPEVLSILLIADYPAAETRFLKNFLGEQNHKVTVRYRVSKDKYRSEFVNASQRPITRLTESFLNSVDLVITDDSGLTSLSNSEIQVLQEAQRLGLGILTLLNTPEPGKAVRNFLNIETTGLKTDSVQLSIQKQRTRFSATAVRVSSKEELSVLQQDASGRIISAYQTSGLGKSGFQLLTNTYILQLSGQKETYAAVWSDVISKLARKEIRKYDLTLTTRAPYYTNEPIGFSIICSGDRPVISIDSAEIPLVENSLVKNVWYGKFWAGQPGWHSLHIKQDSSQHNFFVSSPGSRDNIRLTNQQKELKRMASPENTSAITQHLPERIPPVIFFLLFLVSAGFLWLAPKL